MNYSSLVSFIVPVFNGEMYIERCLQSIYLQTYSKIEIVVVDDGSTDNSFNIIKKCSSKDKRIRYYTQKNKGVSAARNFALTKIKGEYVVFVDADDWIEPDYVECNYLIMSQQEADIVINDFFYNSKSFESISRTFNIEKGELSVDYIKKILISFDNMNSPCISLYSSKIIHDNHIVFPENISYGEDNIFNIYYFDFVKKAIYTQKAFYHYEIHEGSGCRHLHKNQLEMYEKQLKIKEYYGNKWSVLDEFTNKDLVHLIGTHLASFLLMAAREKKFCDYKHWMRDLYRTEQFITLNKNSNIINYSLIPKTYRVLVKMIIANLDLWSYLYCKCINYILRQS